MRDISQIQTQPPIIGTFPLNLYTQGLQTTGLDQVQIITCFVLSVDWNIDKLTCLPQVYNCLPTAATELSPCDRDGKSLKYFIWPFAKMDAAPALCYSASSKGWYDQSSVRLGPVEDLILIHQNLKPPCVVSCASGIWFFECNTTVFFFFLHNILRWAFS